MNNIEIKPDPERRDYAKANITAQKAIELAEKGVFEKFALCTSVWNNYIAPCTLEELKYFVQRMLFGSVYISLDGKTLFINAVSNL